MATAHDENTLYMGPTDDGWQYRRGDKTYDLTRCSQGQRSQDVPAPLVLRTTAGAPDTKIAIDPRRTALVVVDMQNFFLHARCREHPTGVAAVAPTCRVIESCRRAEIQVVWLNWGLTDADLAAMPAAVVAGFARGMVADARTVSGLGTDLGGGSGRMLMKGAWNAQVYAGDSDGARDNGGPSLAAAVRPDLGDVLCDKTRMSGLWSPQEPLRAYLSTTDAGRTIRTLLFAGVNTDQCVLGTLADAYNQGWDCVAVEDCCATTTPSAQATTMRNIAVGYRIFCVIFFTNGQNCYGFVINSSTFAEGVDSFCAAQPEPALHAL